MKNKKKVKRPFYKRWWFWIVVVIILAIGFNVVNGTNDHADSTKSTENASSTNTSKTAKKDVEKAKKTLKKTFSDNNSNEDKNLISEKQFKDITIGENGSSMAELKREFGNPDSDSTTTISNVEADQLVWNGVAKAQLASAITVSFSDGHAISKGITGLKVNHKKELDTDKFESITDGMSEKEVIKQLGEPDGYSESNISGKVSKVLTYSSNIKGDMGANFNITLTNGSVSDKEQSGVK